MELAILAITIILIFSVFYVCVIAAFGFIMLMGGSERYKGTKISKVYYYFNKDLPDKFNYYYVTYVGNANIEKLDYLCDKTPILSLFFLSLILGGIPIWLIFGYPFIPLYHKILSWICLVETLFSFYFVSFSDPGYITDNNQAEFLSSFPYDDVIYHKGLTCTTCKIVKPARSKHCTICNKCVARFDHHCPWTNNCVGEKNLNKFLLFLLSTTIMCLYGAYLFFFTFWEWNPEISNALFKLEIDGKMAKPDKLMLFLFPRMAWSFTLTLLLALGGLVIGSFFVNQFYLVCLNTTTNETFKWNKARAEYRKLLLEARKQQQIEKAANPSASDHNGTRMRKSKIATRVDGAVAEKGWKFKNSYDRGTFENIWEVIYPPVYRPHKTIVN